MALLSPQHIYVVRSGIAVSSSLKTARNVPSSHQSTTKTKAQLKQHMILLHRVALIRDFSDFCETTSVWEEFLPSSQTQEFRIKICLLTRVWLLAGLVWSYIMSQNLFPLTSSQESPEVWQWESRPVSGALNSERNGW